MPWASYHALITAIVAAFGPRPLSVASASVRETVLGVTPVWVATSLTPTFNIALAALA